MRLALRVPPVQLDRERDVFRQRAEPEMEVGAPFSRVAVAAIDLGHQAPAVRKEYGRGGPDRGTPREVAPGMTRARLERREAGRAERKHEVESQERAGVRSVVVVERRR